MGEHEQTGGVAIAAILVASMLLLAHVDTAPQSSAPQQFTEDQRLKSRVAAMSTEWTIAPNYNNPHLPYSEGTTRQDPATAHNERAQYDPTDDYWGLPQDDGFEIVYAQCSACHSIKVAMDQRIAKPQWAYLLNWMVEEQNMPALPPNEEKLVLDYLARHFGPDG